MDTPWQVLSPNVFLIPGEGSTAILYAPLQGVVMEVNRAFAERFRHAMAGDAGAAAELGTDLAAVARFAGTPESARRRLEPEWPSAFEPASATIFLTHKCTLRCSYCYCHGGVGADMPWPVFERAVRFVLENARRQGLDPQLGFHGGDVGACWPLFERGVAFIEDQGAAAGIRPLLSIGTNGFYTPEQASFIARHVGSATVSIDGVGRVHDRYRATASGQPSLERILEAVRIFEAGRMVCSVRMTVTDESVECLPESVDFICRHTGAALIRAEPLYSRGRAATSGLRAPDPGRFVAMFREARAVAKGRGRQLAYSGARLGGVFGSFCSYPSPTFGVTPEGNLTCCYEVLHPDDPLRDPFFYGRIPADGSTIAVDAGRVAAIREWARRRREACAGCFCVFACAGDCAAKVMDGATAADGVPARCRITRALVRDLLHAALAGEDPRRPPPGALARAPAAGPCACMACAKPVASAAASRPEPEPGRGPES